MSFSFKVNKPKDLRKTLEDVRNKVKEHKGSFVGNEKEGKVSVRGVKGMYVVAENAVEIAITEKPFYWPEFIIKSYIVDTFKKCSI